MSFLQTSMLLLQFFLYHLLTEKFELMHLNTLGFLKIIKNGLKKKFKSLLFILIFFTKQKNILIYIF